MQKFGHPERFELSDNFTNVLISLIGLWLVQRWKDQLMQISKLYKDSWLLKPVSIIPCRNVFLNADAELLKRYCLNREGNNYGVHSVPKWN